MADVGLHYYGSIEIEDPEVLFEEYQVRQDDLIHYRTLIEQGKTELAIDQFVKKYHVPITELFTEEIQSYLAEASKGELSRENNLMLTSAVVALVSNFASKYIGNFEQFTKQSYAPPLFEEQNIVSKNVQQAVLDETLAQFSTLTQGALSQTEATVLENIRAIQKQFIVENQIISETPGMIGDLLNSEVDRFKATMKEVLPDYYKMMEEGKVIFDRSGRAWDMDTYGDMSIRTTLLNVDRTSVEVAEKIDGSKVVEYYLRDDRAVKNEREICQQILNTTTDGMALLALDQDTADKLGIMTLDEAYAEGAMGPYCRHSIRAVEGSDADAVDKSLESVDEEVA
jgi:hypothetical protein